jgi:hypothetical protein
LEKRGDGEKSDEENEEKEGSKEKSKEGDDNDDDDAAEHDEYDEEEQEEVKTFSVWVTKSLTVRMLDNRESDIWHIIKSTNRNQADMVAHACNPSIWEAKAGGSQVPGQPRLHVQPQLQQQQQNMLI